jgi:hypothetical protein
MRRLFMAVVVRAYLFAAGTPESKARVALARDAG